MARVTINGKTLELSNEDKVLFPEDGITKGEIIDYYQRIAERMLPHIRSRPVTMIRFPDGIGRPGFYQKDVSDYFPAWLKRVTVARKEGGTTTYPLCNDGASLAYLANQAAVSIHVWLSRAGQLHHPDLMVFDMDPPGGDFAAARAAARAARALLRELGLVPFVQTTGSRGLHVVVPLDGKSSFTEVRQFSQAVARLLAARRPEQLTTEHRKNKRGDRLFIDTGRNAYAQTFAAPYTVRPRPGAPVAAPLDWSELGKGDSQRYNIRNIFRRLGRKDDPWESMWKRRCSLQEPMRRLKAMTSGKTARGSAARR
jgi:bifunctional non-homologous end joining protein LigD